MVLMVAAQVLGHDVTIAFAARAALRAQRMMR